MSFIIGPKFSWNGNLKIRVKSSNPPHLGRRSKIQNEQIELNDKIFRIFIIKKICLASALFDRPISQIIMALTLENPGIFDREILNGQNAEMTIFIWYAKWIIEHIFKIIQDISKDFQIGTRPVFEIHLEHLKVGISSFFVIFLFYVSICRLCVNLYFILTSMNTPRYNPFD